MGGPAEAAAGGCVAKGPTPASVCPGSGSPRTGVGIWGAFHRGRVLAMASCNRRFPGGGSREIHNLSATRGGTDGAAPDAQRDRPACPSAGRATTAFPSEDPLQNWPPEVVLLIPVSVTRTSSQVPGPATGGHERTTRAVTSGTPGSPTRTTAASVPRTAWRLPDRHWGCGRDVGAHAAGAWALLCPPSAGWPDPALGEFGRMGRWQVGIELGVRDVDSAACVIDPEGASRVHAAPGEPGDGLRAVPVGGQRT